jgi:hypothetical protein
VAVSTYHFILVPVLVAGCAFAVVFLAAWQFTADLPIEPEPDDEDDF